MNFTDEVIRERAKEVIERSSGFLLSREEAVSLLDHPEGFVRLSAAIWIELHCLKCGHGMTFIGICDACHTSK
jgi:hypothetical protein